MIIIAGYFAFALGVGIYFTRRASENVKEFFIGGRKFPWWLAGTSMVATSFAADTPLFITGLVRNKGIYENWMWWCFAVSGMLAVFVFSRWWRRSGVITDVELAELRYGGREAKALRFANGLLQSLVVNVFTISWVMVATKKIVSITLDVHDDDQNTEALVILGLCAFAVLYSSLSGLWGVVVTDFIQFGLAMIGSVALAIIVVSEVGGLAGLQDKLASADLLSRTKFVPDIALKGGVFSLAFWKSAVVAFFVYIFVIWWTKNTDGGAAVIQRINSSKDERHAFGSTMLFQVANNALRPWPWIIVALASLVLLSSAELPINEAGKVDHEAAYVVMMTTYMPSGLLGIMVASLMAAFMSTVDTHLNLSAAYLVNDVYRRFIEPGKSEDYYVAVSRIAVVLIMLVVAVVAYFSDSISGIFVMMIALVSGIGPVIIARWFWWRVNAWSEISAMIASFVANLVVPLVLSSCLPPGEGVPFTLRVMLVMPFSLLVWISVTLLTRPVDMEILSKFYRRVRPIGFWGPVARVNPGVRPDTGLAWLVLDWFSGLVMVFGLTFAIGKFLLLEYVSGSVFLGMFLVSSAFVIYRIVNRPVPVTPAEEGC